MEQGRLCCGALCIFIKALEGNRGWGLRSGLGEKEEGWGGLQGRLSNCLHVNFKLNSPCPGTIYTLECKSFFSVSLALSSFVTIPLFFFFLETLDC